MKKMRKMCYTHKEIAMLYFPDMQPKSASRKLSVWIQNDPGILNELEKTGFRQGCRMFSPLQVEILFSHFGEPDGWSLDGEPGL